MPYWPGLLPHAGASAANADEEDSVAVLRMALDQERSLVNILA